MKFSLCRIVSGLGGGGLLFSFRYIFLGGQYSYTSFTFKTVSVPGIVHFDSCLISFHAIALGKTATCPACCNKIIPCVTVAEHTKPESAWLVAKHSMHVAKPINLGSCATAVPSQRRQAGRTELRLSMRSTQMKMSIIIII